MAAGTYAGPGNIDIDFGGKHVVLKASDPDGPMVTVIDCENTGRGFHFHSGESAATAVVGFTVTNGQTDRGGAIHCEYSSPQIRDCIITDSNSTYGAGGIDSYLSTPTFADCTIVNNSPYGVWMEHGSVRIEGAVELASNDWMGNDLILYGEGTLQLDSDAILNLNDSRIRCNISGTGSIYVDFNAELIIEKEAVIDFGTAVDPAASGRILCDGLLRVIDDARIMDAEVYVRRSSVEDNAIILNSVVTAEGRLAFRPVLHRR